MSKDKPVTILPDGGPDVTSAGVNWNEVPEFAQHYAAATARRRRRFRQSMRSQYRRFYIDQLARPGPCR
jgi:hypothetical protein